MPEFTAPGLGRENNKVTIDLEVGPDASGVFYALGGSGGGLTCYMDKGYLLYGYNMMIIERYTDGPYGRRHTRTFSHFSNDREERSGPPVLGRTEKTVSVGV